MIKYICRKCSAEFKIPQEDRIKCFACGKLSLMPVQETVAVAPEATQTEQSSSDDRDRFGRRKVKVFVENKFHDDGTQCVEDKEFTKAVKFTVSQREERLSQLYKRTCGVCKKDFETKAEREYRCTNCSKR